MTRWHWSTYLEYVLAVATVAMVTAVTFPSVVKGCPELCQCTQSYYAYCQKIGLTSDSVQQVVKAVPYQALLLDLSANSVDRLSSGLFDTVPNLEYLFLATNRIQSLGLSVFHHQQQLKELSLRGNRLKEVGAGIFVNLANLRKLFLDSNDIERLKVRAFSLVKLQELHLQGNRLTMLAPTQLSGLTALQMLDLSDNLIQTLEVGAFVDLSNLQVLRLSRNRLSSLAENVFEGLTSLKELHLDGNTLPSLDCFDVPNFASTLQRLVLANNSLVAVPQDVLSKLKSLKVLELNNNRITSVGHQAFKDLQLDSLTLAHNQLDTLNRDMLDGTRRISRLDLSFNRLHTIKTGAMDSFRESVYILNMAGNSLSTLDRGMFRGMRNMQSLNLSSNSLWSILDSTFQELTLLASLDLDYNELQWLSADLLQGPSLRRLSVLDNPLRELRGFTFENVNHPVLVSVNLTLQTSTESSVMVRWPFRRGGQLYWRLKIWCVPADLSDPTCDSPLREDSIPPNKESELVSGLRPATSYFVCINPVFLNLDVKVSQCGLVSTSSFTQTTGKPQGAESQTSNGAPCRTAQDCVLWASLVLTLTAMVWTDLWLDISLLILRRTRLSECVLAGSCGSTDVVKV